jgi:hypothetical protein
MDVHKEAIAIAVMNREGTDGRWLFFPQLDEQSSNLMMIENWH